MSQGAAPRGPWPHVRAALVALHLVAIFVAAVPAPEGGMRRAAWKDPTVQDELHAWAERLRGLGLTLSDEAFEDRLWEVGKGYTRARNALLEPLDPYYRLAGTHQSWRMFVAPHRYPSRLHLSVQEAGEWRDVYVARDPQHAWMARQLDHDRFRSALFRYAWPTYGATWQQLGTWLAQRAAVDFPAATHFRLRYYKQRTPSPAEARRGDEPPGKWVRERVVDLAQLRAGQVPP